MDYVVKTDDGKELVIEVGNVSESKKRLEAYYNALLQYNCQSEDAQTSVFDIR